ncbi:UNVERIFIED_CONTAM: Birc3 [Trichonephila clavipes]
MANLTGFSKAAISKVFKSWNRGRNYFPPNSFAVIKLRKVGKYMKTGNYFLCECYYPKLQGVTCCNLSRAESCSSVKDYSLERQSYSDNLQHSLPGVSSESLMIKVDEAMLSTVVNQVLEAAVFPPCIIRATVLRQIEETGSSFSTTDELCVAASRLKDEMEKEPSKMRHRVNGESELIVEELEKDIVYVEKNNYKPSDLNINVIDLRKCTIGSDHNRDNMECAETVLKQSPSGKFSLIGNFQSHIANDSKRVDLFTDPLNSEKAKFRSRLNPSKLVSELEFPVWLIYEFQILSKFLKRKCFICLHSDEYVLSKMSRKFEGVETTLSTDRCLCKICMDQEVSVLFLPCSHLLACTECAPALKFCPLCRQTIQAISSVHKESLSRLRSLWGIQSSVVKSSGFIR